MGFLKSRKMECLQKRMLVLRQSLDNSKLKIIYQAFCCRSQQAWSLNLNFAQSDASKSVSFSTTNLNRNQSRPLKHHKALSRGTFIKTSTTINLLMKWVSWFMTVMACGVLQEALYGHNKDSFWAFIMPGTKMGTTLAWLYTMMKQLIVGLLNSMKEGPSVCMF